MQKKISHQESQFDHTFNFNYSIDLDKKSKSIEHKQSGLDFHDFPQFWNDDRSNTSFLTSQKKWIPSEVMRRSPDETMILIDTHSDFQNRSKRGIVLEEPSIGPKSNLQKSFKDKFIDSNKLVQITTNKKYIKKDTVPDQIYEQDKQNQNNYNNKLFARQSINENTHKNIIIKQIQIDPQNEIHNAQQQINYYKLVNQKIDYESLTLAEQLQKMVQLIQNPVWEIELMKNAKETQKLNNLILQQRKLEKATSQIIEQTKNKYQKLYFTTKNTNFLRPDQLTDEQKMLLDDINKLREEMNQLQQQNYMVDFQNHIPVQQTIGIGNLQCNEKTKFIDEEKVMMNGYIEEIKTAQKKCQIPDYIKNIKMCLLKDEWIIYENQQMCIHVSYKQYPICQITFGNKTNCVLRSFTMKENTIRIIENDYFFSKNKYCHRVILSKFSRPFLKMEITYEVFDSQTHKQNREIILFIPTLPLKHGQFIPTFDREFQEKNTVVAKIFTNYKVQIVNLDNQLFFQNYIGNLCRYFPHLHTEYNFPFNKYSNIKKCYGIFKLYQSTDEALITFEQIEQRLEVNIKTHIPFFKENLKFLLTNI